LVEADFCLPAENTALENRWFRALGQEEARAA
jgi:hypothetical protein